MAIKKHEGRQVVLTVTVIAAGSLGAYRGISQAGSYATAGQHMAGVSFTSAYANDELAVDVMGITIAQAGGAIAADALVEVGSDGKFITKASGKAVGRAISAATGDNSTFELLTTPVLA